MERSQYKDVIHRTETDANNRMKKRSATMEDLFQDELYIPREEGHSKQSLSLCKFEHLVYLKIPSWLSKDNPKAI